MGKTFHKPEALADTITHYCPGCTHGVAHRLIAEVIDELGIRDRTVGIAPVGCAVLMYNYFTFDFQESAHGRAPERRGETVRGPLPGGQEPIDSALSQARQ